MYSLLQKQFGQPHSDANTVVVYGAATVYSSSCIVLLGSMTVVLLLLLGDGFAGSVLLLLASMFIFLELYACLRNAECTGDLQSNLFHVLS